MGNYNRDSRSGGGRNFSEQGGDREMHRATCAKCGRDCEVPFKPTGIRPVFCKDCFQRNKGEEPERFGNNDRRGPRRPSFDRSQSYNRPQNSEQFNALNTKLDMILDLLRPKLTKPEKAPRSLAKKPIEKKLSDPEKTPKLSTTE